MIVYDEKAQRWYNDQTGQWCAPPAEEPVDHTQNPLIGVALLVFVLWLAYQMTAAYYGGITIVWVP